MIPSFTLQTRDGPLRGGLFELFCRVVADDLVDLPVVQPHQRAPCVTTLAIIMEVLRRYAESEPITSEQWEAEWDRQIGADALRLVAPEDEPAFLQPPTREAKTPLWLSEVDVTFAQQAHETKPQLHPTTEQWIYALMASPWRQYGGRGWYAGARDGLAVVLPSIDGTMGSEIKLLCKAYADMPTGEVGRDTVPSIAADHLIWLQRYDKSTQELTLSECPHPCLDARPIRLVERNGQIEARGAAVKSKRIAKGGNLADPHVPLVDGDPYRLIKARSFNAKFQHAALFGSSEIHRPRILDLVDYRVVRLCALGTDPPGKTKGYWELIVNAARGKRLFRFTPQEVSDRPATLSAQMLGVMNTTSSRILWPALATLHELSAIPGKAESVRQIIGRYTTEFREAMAMPSLEIVLQLIHAGPDPEGEQQAMHHTVREPLMRTFRQAEGTVSDLLRRARAELHLHDCLRRHNMEPNKMTSDDMPHLARQTYSILGEMVKHLTPNDRASLRTMSLVDPPLSYWMLLAAVPIQQVDDLNAERVWRVALRALGRLRLGGPGIGSVLAQTDMPEMRVQRLLTATGATLTDTISDTVRWLIAKDVNRGAFSELVTLGLGDALAEPEALDWARHRIALDYARQLRRQSRQQLTAA